jgi:hypothetical protein
MNGTLQDTRTKIRYMNSCLGILGDMYEKCVNGSVSDPQVLRASVLRLHNAQIRLPCLAFRTHVYTQHPNWYCSQPHISVGKKDKPLKVVKPMDGTHGAKAYEGP